jgi:hypothetical protein
MALNVGRGLNRRTGDRGIATKYATSQGGSGGLWPIDMAPAGTAQTSILTELMT